ncbi:unnamed protein product [Owenia fusiformis]|uniref:GPI mannosyltransferase 2 n=1 Tax=Owenia fusiformis TaxID=6347 RepID=A0A8S4P2R0_OWEFU|nr:unnamed protein product [Owenia fusiformis]
MALPAEQKVRKFALISRIAVFVVQVVANAVIPDHNAGVFNPPAEQDKTILDDIITFLFAGYRRWDSEYFLHIAEHGYTYENCLAFFPLFPLTVRVVANSLLYPLQWFATYSNVLLVSAVFINLYCFVKSAEMLYHLGKAILNHESLAYKACLMYCINPASVFFSVAYSESMFAWITFTGMQRFDGNTRNGSFWFAVTTSIRANGLINMGYLWHRKLGEYIRLVPGLRGLSLKDKIMVGNVVFWMICTIPLVLYSILCIAPFLLVQYFAYTQFCTGNKADGIPQNILEYGTARGYTIMGVGPPPLWCKWTIPLSYSHVQNSHWDVGFLRYFEVKQVPNFLLASPMIVICMLTALRYISKNLKYSITLGLGRKSYIHKKSDASVPDLKDTGFDSEKCLPYVLHMLAMVIFGFFFMHIQVVTRFIASSCPVIYWYVAMVPFFNVNIFRSHFSMCTYLGPIF